tara:strand:- start:142 stop:456 length:315 start_codon:yes stop_codon:yes gene_type:complete
MSKQKHIWNAESRRLAIITVLDNYKIEDIDVVFKKAADLINAVYASETNPKTSKSSIKMGFDITRSRMKGLEAKMQLPEGYNTIMDEELLKRNISPAKFALLFS